MKLDTILALSGAFAAALAAPTTTITPSVTTVTTTTTSTISTGSASTVYTFLSGNPPSSSSSAPASSALNKAKRATTSGSSVPTVVTITDTVVDVTTVAAPTTTSTFYPCASPFPSLTPTLPYGDASLPSGFSTQNSIFEVGTTTEGASAQACCNACFFELANCVQAYWYSYEGCVVSLATNSSLAGAASGQQVSTVCPAGTFNGLSYANDTNPSFRSTGNIAGPCGQTYDNII